RRRLAAGGLARLFVASCLGAAMLCACQTDRVTTSDGWPLPPDPRPAPAPPANLTADRMVFTVGSKPDDSNGNGFPDSIKAAVSLFSLAHPMALQQDGVFIFTLYAQGQAGAPNAKPLGVWRVESSSLQATLA